MSNINSYADVVLDWEGLLTAVLENAQFLPNIEPQRAAMEKHLALTKAVKARREAHTAGRQEATQELRLLVAQGRDLAIRLRNAIKAEIGSKTERLVHFGMIPIRKRTRKVKPAEVKPPVEEPETPKPAA
jgi:hypothetical protein